MAFLNSIFGFFGLEIKPLDPRDKPHVQDVLRRVRRR